MNTYEQKGYVYPYPYCPSAGSASEGLLDRAEKAIGPDSAATMRSIANKKFHNGAMP